jgi:hypothetical protein
MFVVSDAVVLAALALLHFLLIPAEEMQQCQRSNNDSIQTRQTTMPRDDPSILQVA